MQALIGLIGGALGSRLAQAVVGQAVDSAVAPIAGAIGSAIGPATGQFLADNAGRFLTNAVGGAIGAHTAGAIFSPPKPPTDGGVGPSGQSRMAEASIQSGASWGVYPGGGGASVGTPVSMPIAYYN